MSDEQKQVFCCVWCRHILNSTPEPLNCCAPDGDGHLYRQEMEDTPKAVKKWIKRKEADHD